MEEKFGGYWSLRRGSENCRCICLRLVVGTWGVPLATSGDHSNMDLLLPTFFFLFFFPTPTLGRPYTKVRAAAREEPHPAVAGEGERPKMRMGGCVR